MSSPGMRHRRRGQHETPKPTATPPLAAEQGATLNLRNPDVLRGEWDAEARKSEALAVQDREAIAQLLKESDEHKGQAGQAANDEMRLMQDLAEAQQRREFHDGQKEAKLSDAKKATGRVQFHEDRAADLRAAMKTLPSARVGHGEVDPTGPTRRDLSEDLRLDEGVANLMRHHDEDPAGEAGAA